MTSSFLFSFSPQMGFLSRLYHENRTILALFGGDSDQKPGLKTKRGTPTVKRKE
jgi:hypothetical protein